MQCLTDVQADQSFWNSFLDKTSFQYDDETKKWTGIVDKMYYPKQKNSMLFLQQDGFLDKVNRVASDLDKSERPINQHWSWDRILRSIFIKQADVLQGMYFLEHEFDEETIRANFDYYEPRTVHESSLSPCVHSILATKLGKHDKAYEMYLRTARLDLDDYNHEADEGLHITSMAGTWMSVVEGFGGKRVKEGKLSLEPSIPSGWTAYRFNIVFRGHIISLTIKPDQIMVKGLSDGETELLINGSDYMLSAREEITISR